MTHRNASLVLGIAFLLLGATIANGKTWGQEGTNMILVARKGGDFRSIQAALDSITDATEDNPYLIYVAPGIYSEHVQMKDHVVIEGAGEQLTKIISGHWFTVAGSWNSELRSLTVECTGTGLAEHGCSAIRGRPPRRILHVTIRATGRQAAGIRIFWPPWPDWTLNHVTLEIQPTSDEGNCWGFGIVQELFDGDRREGDGTGTVQMDDVSIRVTNQECLNTGLLVLGSSWTFRISSSTLVVEGNEHSCAVLGFYADIDLRGVQILGTPCALSGPDSSIGVHHSNVRGNLSSEWNGSVHLAHSEFGGKLLGSGHSCFASCDADMNPLDKECQPILH